MTRPDHAPSIVHARNNRLSVSMDCECAMWTRGVTIGDKDIPTREAAEAHLRAAYERDHVPEIPELRRLATLWDARERELVRLAANPVTLRASREAMSLG